MEIVKKNIVSILCGVVALAAIVFYFVGAKPKFAGLQKDMTTRIGKPAEMTTLVRNEHFLPSVKDGPKIKLDFLPNPEALKQVDQIIAQIQGQANAAIDRVLKVNRNDRELLVAGSLPKPSNQIPAYDFRSQYVQVLKRGGVPDTTKTRTPNLPDGVLKSAEPPTLEEISAAKQAKWKDEFVPYVVLTNGQPANLREVAADFVKATENFDEEFRKKRAEQYKIYLEPGALAMSSVAAPGNPNAPAPVEMWFAQMTLWIQHDVCNSIAALNSAKPEFVNIRSTPVKHLLSIDIKPDITMYAVKGGTANGMPAAPTGDAGAPPAAGTKDYTLSSTGRVSNSMYDVVHFGIDAVVDARYVKAFLQQLQYARFITVLEVDVQGVDLDEALDEGYEYGRQTVVEVKIKAEALFLRDWTAWVAQPKRADGTQPPPVQGPMPTDVQKMLGIPAPNQENKPADAAPAN